MYMCIMCTAQLKSWPRRSFVFTELWIVFVDFCCVDRLYFLLVAAVFSYFDTTKHVKDSWLHTSVSFLSKLYIVSYRFM